MTIGVDGNEANVQIQVGVSVYTSELLKYFAKWADRQTSFIVYLRTQPRSFMPKENEYFRYEVVNGPFLWSQIFLPIRLYINHFLNTSIRYPLPATRSKSIDVFFAPAHYAPRFCPIPTVVTIHDLSYFLFPDEFLKKDLYQLKNWTEYSVKKASHVIAVSKTTKKDILKYYQLPDTKITVVYNGFEKVSENADTGALKKYGLKKQKYILYVGTIQPRKNLQTLIRAFNGFDEENQEFKLVIVGKKGWLYDEIFDEVKKLHLEEQVIFTGYETNEIAHELYANAFCYVLPSLYEGFGIPILEAMSAGCPVIASHASSLPEIGGDAALYFDPKNDEELLEKILSLMENEELRARLIAKGFARIKEFSWEKCGEETLNVIKALIPAKAGIHE